MKLRNTHDPVKYRYIIYVWRSVIGVGTYLLGTYI